ncbi:MAG: 2-oxoacid:acceptor oxidoreductase subunit alpha [Anaerolineales bacterium]|jgi:2-oxoglutarate ferredoxin oxidoreductase subunit alpha|nr:2-oxoacid:acceptor oxidoreductase subunit alpha [Anaerolineales bacterium]
MTQNMILNDFSITVGTPNGSGSSTANTTLLRALFKMGIPVSGKNLFPSNIQGLPTWFTIRVSGEGFTSRREEQEIMVAMNPASFLQDLAQVSPGGAFFYADDIKLPINRDDISIYPMPVKQLVRSDPDIPSNLRDLVANMVYVGILAEMLGIDQEKIEMALQFHFKNKPKPVSLNMSMVRAGAAWAAANLTKSDPYRVEALNKTDGLIMTEGNVAAALGSIYGGVQFVGWYPITPASSLAESLNEYLPQLRQSPDGKNTFAVVQAEDELAAIGMCVGAGWSGLRAMTATSGPGMSLMTEYAGLAYFAEVPLVIWDVQRMGPSTGLPTRTSQGDLAFVANMGHGDIDSLILLPGSIQECFEFGWRSFDIAERIQTPVYVLIDLDFGMNQWMSAPFLYPDTPMDRGKILWEEGIEKSGSSWGRYKDVDGDGIPFRTVPGNTHPLSAYFTRGTGHTPEARYSEAPDVWTANMARLQQKYESAKEYLPKPIVQTASGANFGILAYGSTDPAVEEARFKLERDHNLPSDYLRLRAIPFANEVGEFIAAHERIYVVELNRDGQLKQLLTIKYPEYATRLVSIAFNDGLPPTARWIRTAILEKEEN